ncbi:hypothetical protein D3C71_1585900 [compost metagenome]
MKFWTCAEFAGHWPVGCAAVVAEDSAEAAAKVLGLVLRERGLAQTINPEQMIEFVGGVRILCDGNY